jgi:hypothetical protein
VLLHGSVFAKVAVEEILAYLRISSFSPLGVSEEKSG